MAKLVNKKQVLDRFSRYARQKRDADGDALLAEFFDQYLGALPTAERISGNIYEGWLSAIERGAKRTPKLSQVIGRFSSFRSGDAVASAAGKASLNINKRVFRGRFSVSLPFAEKVERGQPIGVIAPGGTKDHSGYGKLYSRRNEGRRGMLMWVDEGGVHFAKIRVPRGKADGVGAFAAAAEATANMAQSLGWKRI